MANAGTTRQMPERTEQNHPTRTAVHVMPDNARHHHAGILQLRPERPERRLKPRFPLS